MFHRVCQSSVIPGDSQKGGSVLELLIAIAISSVTFSGVCSMMAQYGQRFQNHHITSGLKQESRIGLEVFTSELKLAGTGEGPGEAVLLKMGKTDLKFNANLSGLQTVLSQPAQAGTQDLVVENGSGWPDGKHIILCSLDRCMANRLSRAGRTNALSVDLPLPAMFPVGSAVFVSNRVHYYLGKDDQGVPRVMREVDGGIGTLISGISDFRLEYFGRNGFPTTDSALVARVRVTVGLKDIHGLTIHEIGLRTQ
jgi:hypothetical protein